MIFECEGKPAIQEPKEAQIRKAIASLKSYGPSSYASLTDDEGNYAQVAGGGVTCLLEFYRSSTNERLRGHGEFSNVTYPDGTVLVFRAGKIPMLSDEWFKANEVADVFCAFLSGHPFPFGIRWRKAPGFD